jgi:hypothetical protein
VVLVYRDDFQSGYAGWSGTTTTQACGTATILGGYGALAGGTVSKTFSQSGITHSKVLVRLDYYAIDSWDGEMAYVEVGGWRCWERWPNMGQGGNNICGNSSGHRDAVYLAECAVPHTASTITVVVGSSLNQDPTDESFGIDDVEIWVR